MQKKAFFLATSLLVTEVTEKNYQHTHKNKEAY